MKFRVARHTNNLDRITKFYCEVLGLEILGNFINHNNYNGVFLGLKNMDWHLEFTTSDTKANHKFDEDDILVFYPKNIEQFDKIKENILKNNIKILKAKNPYWNENGILICDPDGYNIIISNQ